VQAHRSLLANASHELRSPLARMKMAVSMLDEASPAEREGLRHEIDKNVAELDGLVEEVLLASRLDAAESPLHVDKVDLLGVAAEEAARVGAHVEGRGQRLRQRRRAAPAPRRPQPAREREALRRQARSRSRSRAGAVRRRCRLDRGRDRGPGVPEAMRERIFEPFFRLPGHAEQAGGVGLGLALVKQIAVRHGGNVRCEARAGGGSVFVIEMPAS
jgi:signal transduction histidine kinase